MEWTSLSTLKYFLGIQQSNTSLDDFLTTLLNSAEKILKSLLGRDNLIATDLSQIYHGNGKKRLLLKDYPVNSISSVSIDNEEISQASGNSAGWYLIAAELGILGLKGYTFTEGVNNVVIQYNAGWQTGNFPADLEILTYRIATGLYHQRDVIGVQSLSLEGLGKKISAILTDDDLKVLNLYKRRSLGVY